MFVEVFDDAVPCVVWLFCGSANTVDDHQRWLTSLTRTDAAFGSRCGAAVLIIDDGNPSPPPAVRDQITSTARAIKGRSPLAVVTSSPLARTVIVGLHVAGIVRFPVKGFAAEAAAVQWLARPAIAGVDAVVVAELIAEARARASRRA